MTAPKARRSRVRRRVALVALVLFVAFAALTARLFVWPSLPPLPEHADAIIELGWAGRPGRGDASRWPSSTVAPLVIQSTLARRRHLRHLPAADPRRHRRVLPPDPGDDEGRGPLHRRAGAAAHWSSVIIVTTPDHAWRARLRVERCFPGQVYVADQPAADVGLAPPDPLPVGGHRQGRALPARLLSEGPMDFWRTVLVLFRRWYITVPAFFATLGVAAAAYSAVPVQYESGSVLVLTTPLSGGTEATHTDVADLAHQPAAELRPEPRPDGVDRHPADEQLGDGRRPGHHPGRHHQLPGHQRQHQPGAARVGAVPLRPGNRPERPRRRRTSPSEVSAKAAEVLDQRPDRAQRARLDPHQRCRWSSRRRRASR